MSDIKDPMPEVVDELQKYCIIRAQALCTSFDPYDMIKGAAFMMTANELHKIMDSLYNQLDSGEDKE